VIILLVRQAHHEDGEMFRARMMVLIEDEGALIMRMVVRGL
jgi:hypothetical protein